MKKNQKEIEAALMKPLHPSYPFSTNGIYFLIGKPGAGKSYWIWKHILITERLFKHPYYQKIIFCSISGKMDKTAEAMSKNLKTPIVHKDVLLVHKYILFGSQRFKFFIIM